MAQESSDLDAPERAAAVDLSTWLYARVPSLREMWGQEIRARGLGQDPRMDAVVGMFIDQLVGLLPPLLGPFRDRIQPLWDRSAELFGSVAAKRGLAAGEAIEELHILRELVIRDLYRDPPLGGTVPLSLREILRLNRALDRAVTHASVGHMDAMFFEFFETDDPKILLSGDDVADEAASQLRSIQNEVDNVLRPKHSGAKHSHGNN